MGKTCFLSVIDNERIVRQMSKRHPQLMTLKELADLDVHGFVSMLGWSEESIAGYSRTHLVVPTAMTVREALLQTSSGAHFQKMMGGDLGFVRRCREAAAFDYCPIMVTGGQTLEAIPESIQAGAVMLASGFDLTLRGVDPDMDNATFVAETRQIVSAYIEKTKTERMREFPELAGAEEKSDEAWLDCLPHYHPFDIRD